MYWSFNRRFEEVIEQGDRRIPSLLFTSFRTWARVIILLNLFPKHPNGDMLVRVLVCKQQRQIQTNWHKKNVFKGYWIIKTQRLAHYRLIKWSKMREGKIKCGNIPLKTPLEMASQTFQMQRIISDKSPDSLNPCQGRNFWSAWPLHLPWESLKIKIRANIFMALIL